jgi:integrase
MASVWKHPKSPFWTACYTLPDGRRVKQTTKIGNRTKALQAANILESEARPGLSEKHARDLASRLFELLGGQRFAGKTVKAFVEEWAGRKEREVAASTARKYRDSANHFVKFLGPRALADISSITSAEVAAFRDHLAGRLSLGTANGNLKIIRVAFADALRSKLVSVNEAANVPVLKAPAGTAGTRRGFTVPELHRLLATAGPEWRAMILTALYTGGQRLGDVARLTWANVDLQRAEISFTTRKTGRRQILPITGPLAAELAALPSSDDPLAPVFPQAARRMAASKVNGVGALSNQFRDLLAGAGLAEPASHAAALHGRSSRRQSTELSFHSLRHTAGTLMKQAGITSSVVQDIVGHDSAAVSQHYTHIDQDTKRAALSLLPDITKPLQKTKPKKP